MRIGIDIRSLQESEPSGVGEYTYELLRALFSIDQENEYHLLANAKKEIALPALDFPNVTIHRFHYPNKLLNASLRFFGRPKLDQLLGGLDVFFMPNLNFVSLTKATPLVITAHDLSFDFFPRFFDKKTRLWHRLVRPRKLWQNANGVIAVSHHTKQDLTDHNALTPDRLHVIKPGISPIFFAPPDEQKDYAVQTKYDLPGNFILFLATVEPRKNPEAVIEAFKKLKDDPRFSDLHLVLAGRYHKNLLSNSRELESKGVHFLNYVSREDRPALYRLARVFVYPSYYEGFGLPPLEAMSQGTPVIASHASSLGEVLGQAAILIDPHNVEELRAALAEVLVNQSLAKNLEERGKKWAQQFQWDRAARETLACFESVVDQSLSRK